MIDVARDARWGRVSEGYGGDTYTNSVFGVASVKGYQGKSLSDQFSIAACLKHYVGYGESEGGRDYNYNDVSPQALWETYLPPYKACVEAGAATLMSGFNDISGVPATANHYLLTTILKKKWAHIRAVESLENLVGANEDENTGIKIIKRAIEEPLRQICANAGIEGLIVVHNVKEGTGDYGYNARTDVYENLISAGVIDPTKVARVALENVASIAAMLLTTECILADEPNAKDDHAPQMGGGGGGMGGMM